MAESAIQIPRLGSSFAVTTETASLTVNKSSYKSTTIAHAKAGWQPLGVVGTYTNNPNVIVYTNRMTASSVGSATVSISARNWNASSNLPVTITNCVLWTLMGG